MRQQVAGTRIEIADRYAGSATPHVLDSNAGGQAIGACILDQGQMSCADPAGKRVVRRGLGRRGPSRRRRHLVNDRCHRLATLDEGAAVESVRQHRIATSAAIVVAGIAKRRQAQLLVEGPCRRGVSNLAGIIDGHGSWAGPQVLQSDPRVVAAIGIVEDDGSIQRRRPRGRAVVAGELATGSDLVDDRGQRTAGSNGASAQGRHQLDAGLRVENAERAAHFVSHLAMVG